jgi:CBS domain-containing protein
MLVKDIMTPNVESIDADAYLIQAARKMKSFEIGALPVIDKGQVIGMITDRDITVRGVAGGQNPSTTLVRDMMTPGVFKCYEDDNIHDAADQMENKSIHRLLVLNNNNEPVGFVSLADFAVKSRDERLAWEILKRISEPASPHR